MDKKNVQKLNSAFFFSKKGSKKHILHHNALKKILR
jgi:hypothetical protein